MSNNALALSKQSIINVMSPKKRARNKRKASPTNSPTSPSQLKPTKVKSISRNMSQDAATQIMDLLNVMKNDIQSQREEFRAAIKKTNDNTAELSKQITESYNGLKSDMNQMIDGLQCEFKKELISLNTKIDESSNSFKQQVNEINETVVALNLRMDNVEKDYERIAHLNELKLSGIPISDNENLTNSFMKLANLIGYDVSNPANIPSLSRVIKRNRITNEMTVAPTIIMKFIAVHMKETFYGLYLSMLPKRKLTAKDVDFSCETRIIIGENLSQSNRDIFVTAWNLKKENKLSQVYTVNGFVNVKILKGGTAYEIRHKHNLELLLRSRTNNTHEAPTFNRNQTNVTETTSAQSNIQNHEQNDSPMQT